MPIWPFGRAGTCEVRISWPWRSCCSSSCQVQQQPVGMRVQSIACYFATLPSGLGRPDLASNPTKAEKGVRFLHSTTKDTRGILPSSLRDDSSGFGLCTAGATRTAEATIGVGMRDNTHVAKQTLRFELLLDLGDGMPCRGKKVEQRGGERKTRGPAPGCGNPFTTSSEDSMHGAAHTTFSQPQRQRQHTVVYTGMDHVLYARESCACVGTHLEYSVVKGQSKLGR